MTEAEAHERVDELLFIQERRHWRRCGKEVAACQRCARFVNLRPGGAS